MQKYRLSHPIIWIGALAVLALNPWFRISFRTEPVILASPVALTTSALSSLPDLVEKTLPQVVNISSSTVINYRVNGWEDFMQLWGVPQERKQTSLGSGVLIDNEGSILTNNHVVERASEVLVTLIDKHQYRAKIIGTDPKMDLALIQIKGAFSKASSHLFPAAMGDSDTVRIAEPVFAVGNPFGLQHTVTMGIISAKNRTIGLGPFDNFLQTDASINPGNSGGPLFNLKGEVIGINSVIYSRTGQSGGVGFAIPINEAKKILADLKKYGRVPRPWLGILGERISPAISQYYGLPVDKGVIVYNLIQEGPGDQAGLRQGDIIISAEGSPIEEPNDLERVLSKHTPTDFLSLKIRRGRQTRDIHVKLEGFPKLDPEELPKGII